MNTANIAIRISRITPKAATCHFWMYALADSTAQSWHGLRPRSTPEAPLRTSGSRPGAKASSRPVQAAPILCERPRRNESQTHDHQSAAQNRGSIGGERALRRSWRDGDLEHAITLVGEEIVRRLDVVQLEAVGDQGAQVQPRGLDY